MKKMMLIALAIVFAIGVPIGAMSKEEVVNQSYVSTVPQAFPRVRQNSARNSIISISSMIYTPHDVSEARFGFMQRKIYPEEELEFKPVGFAFSQDIYLPKPLYELWWREALATVEYNAGKNSGIFEYYCWEEFRDEENNLKRYAGKPLRMAYIDDLQVASAVCKDLRVHTFIDSVWLRADAAVVGLSDESYDERNLLKGQYLYFDIVSEDGVVQITRNAGRLTYGWKWREINIPLFEFEEKNLFEKKLTVKVHASPAKEDIQVSTYGFQEKEIILTKNRK